MSENSKSVIEVTVTVNAPIEKIWKLWTSPKDIMQWNNPSADWHTTKVENSLRPGGAFLFFMGLKNGDFTFNFTGVYDNVEINRLISYTLNDGRKSTITFTGSDWVTITEAFEPTATDPIEMQRGFCQTVLNSFKTYVESK
jgi:uncharacterized protein YndB with AHSA1/START domain